MQVFVLLDRKLPQETYPLLGILSFSTFFFIWSKTLISSVPVLVFTFFCLWSLAALPIYQKVEVNESYGVSIHTRTLLKERECFYHRTQLARVFVYEYLGVTGVYFKLGLQLHGKNLLQTEFEVSSLGLACSLGRAS